MNAFFKGFTIAAVSISLLILMDLRPAGAQAPLAPCRADIDRLCKGVPPGGGRIIECLKEREDEISPACREHVQATLQKVKTDVINWQKACHADAQRLCKGVPFGGGRVINCLQEHIDQVSPDCKGSLPVSQAPQDPCRADADRFCKGVPPGGGRIVECLKEHQAKLSPGCRQNLKVMEKVHEASTRVVDWQKACHADARRLCKDLPYGDGRVIDCLQQHIDQVSTECKGALR